MLQPGDRAVDPGPRGRDVVAVLDAAGGAHHLGDRGQVAALAVRRTATPQDAGLRDLPAEARELLTEPGLAHPGVTRDQDAARGAAVQHVEQPADQQAQLGVPAEERRLVAETEPGGPRRTQPDELEGVHRLALSLEPQGVQRPPARDGHGRDGGVPTRHDGADTGRVGQPAGGVHRVADDGVGQVRLHPGQDLAGVEPDAQAELAAAAALLGDQPAYGGLHLARRRARPARRRPRARSARRTPP